MEASQIPAKFSIPWGNSAGGGFIRPIPVTSQIGTTDGAASLEDGFPPLNFQPVGSGGVPPFGQDFNGILKQITQWSQWQGAGGLAVYDPTFSSEIGGYPAGAFLAGTAPGVVWLNLVDNNTSNPDTSGANWVSLIPSSGGTITNATIATSAITLQQSGAPTPTAEGQIEWGSTNGQVAIGHNGGTVFIPTGAAPGAISGFTLSNDASSPNTAIDFAAGVASDSTNLYYLKSSALVKALNSAWAAGTGNGGLFSGSMTNGTYHCFVILNPTTGAVDAGFSTSVTASDHPSGFTVFRRVGSIIVAGGVILAFLQTGDKFWLSTGTADVSVSANPGTSAVLAALTVPLGIVVTAIMNWRYGDTNGSVASSVLVTGPAQANTAPSSSIFSLRFEAPGGVSETTGQLMAPTNTSGQVRYRCSASSGTMFLNEMTVGWIDSRN